MKQKLVIQCNCNLLYFKYSTVSVHKLSRVIFLDPVFVDFNYLLQGLLFGSTKKCILTAINARNSLRLAFGYLLFHRELTRRYKQTRGSQEPVIAHLDQSCFQ
jgi:hypothetical protein